MTAGRIILDMPNPALDRDGNPLPKAKLYFYQNGTTTLQDTFTDSTLVVAHANPLIADSAGRFSAVWADITKSFSVRWTDTNDALVYTFDEIVPYAVGMATDASNAQAAAARANLGLGTAAVADTGNADHTLLFGDGNNTWTGTQNFTGAVQRDGNPIGYLGIPINAKDADYTFALTDRGKMVRHTSGSAHTWTIPKNADVNFPGNGDAIVLRNIGTGAVTIARDTGVTLRIVGASTNANATFAQWGLATLINEAVDVWVIQGNGVS